MRIVIIGAGLGGLCLTHGLHHLDVDVAVYERSTRDGAQPASYGIHLNADGLRALHRCLPQANWDMFVATTVPASNVINFHDPRAGLLASLDFRTPEHATDPVTSRRAVTRGNLRDALLFGLRHQPDTVDPVASGAEGPHDTGQQPPTVHWGKKFVSYTHTPDRRIQVHFEDGSTTIADLLVGADGSNSRVRAQRLPDLDRLDLQILNVAGRIPLTPDLSAILPPQLCDTSINNIVPAAPGWMFVSTWATGDSGSTVLSGAEATDRYLIWAWAAPRDSYPSGGADLSADRLQAHVQERIQHWSSALRQLVAATDPADIGPVPLRTMPTLPAWAPDNVTLLGDAIHNMTPMGGIGANTALRDAETLRTALLEHHQKNPDVDVVTAVQDYEDHMRGYANAALQLSTRNATRATNPARIPRSIFRTLLRTADRSPAVKRRIFHTPTNTVRPPS